MTKIQVEMKRGGKMPLEARGRIFIDDDGFDSKWPAVEDLELFWPRKPRDKKSYPVKPELVASWDQVEEAFLNASTH